MRQPADRDRAMSRVTRPALRGSFLGTVLRFWNPIMKRLLASPIHWPLSRWFALMRWTGRRSGTPSSTPVAYLRERSTVWVTTGDRWVRNLEGGATISIRIRGQWREARGVPVTDPEESHAIHAGLFRAHRWFRWLSGIPGAGGGADPVALERAIAAGRILVRIDLDAR